MTKNKDVEVVFLKIEGDETYMLVTNTCKNNDMVKVFRLPKGLKYGTKYVLKEVPSDEN